MKSVLILLSIILINNYSYSQKPIVYKLEDLNAYIKVFSNCNCGDYNLYDSTNLKYQVVKGKLHDTLLVAYNKELPVARYLITSNYDFLSVKHLSYKKDKRKYKIERTKYFLTRKI